MMNRLIWSLVMVAVVAGGAAAVDQLDAFPQPEGLHWSYYPHYYTADKVNDVNGDLGYDNAGISLMEVLVRPTYVRGDWLYNIIVPIGDFNMRDYSEDDYYPETRGRLSLDDLGPTFNVSSSGIGDIVLGVGKYQKTGEWNWLPYASVKLANGPYNKDRDYRQFEWGNYNYGTGQVDLTFESYFNRCGHWSFDGAIKYRHRIKNHDTGYKPGNEISAEILISHGCGEMMGFWHKDMLGLGIDYMISTEAELNGESLEDTEITRLSVGPELYHGITERSHVWFAVKQDIVSKNAAKGTMFWIKYTLF